MRSRSSTCGSDSDWDLLPRGDLRGRAVAAFRLRSLGSPFQAHASSTELDAITLVMWIPTFDTRTRAFTPVDVT